MGYKKQRSDGKLSNAVLKKLIREEESGAKTYHRLGLHDLARDEEGHARTLRGMLR